MKTENMLVDYIENTRFEDLPEKPLTTVKTMLLGIMGTIAAGAFSDECVSLIDLLKDLGGKPEATVLIHGMKLPGHCAALANGTMAQTLDYDDAVVPGVHIGCVTIPAALAAVEIKGGCSGKDFITALTVGIEFANRLNTVNAKTFYGGFHGTGVCGIFGASAAAGRILGLNTEQMKDDLGLTISWAGGSGQNNVEGVRGVSLVAGIAAQAGVFCTQLAQRGVTGPANFLEGPSGWFSMFGTGEVNNDLLTGQLGKRYELEKTLFKRFPSCGLTQTSTQGILEIIEERGIGPDDIAEVNVWVGPFAHKVVGHFELGRNPTMNAQFSIPFCVANALVRKGSELKHFEESAVREPLIAEVAKLVHVDIDPEIEKRDQRAMEMEVKTRGGVVYTKRIDVPRGSPGNEMTIDEHIARFYQCMDFSKKALPHENADKMVALIDKIEDMADVRELISLMVP